MLAQQAFSIDYPLMWEREECNSFDVANGSTQISTSRHALKVCLGRTMIYMYTHAGQIPIYTYCLWGGTWGNTMIHEGALI